MPTIVPGRLAFTATALLVGLAAACGNESTDSGLRGPGGPIEGGTIPSGDDAGSTGSGSDSGDAGTTPEASTPDAGPVPDASTEGGSTPDSGVDSGVDSGAPLTGNNGVWTWTPFPNTYCRDGSNAGLSVNLNTPNTKVVIFFQGGGACFDSTTCAGNPANTTGQQTPSDVGIFDRTNAMNPVADWNYIYIPYCTGDIGAGANPTGTVAGVSGMQMFVGYPNLLAFLDRIVPTFPNASQVVLTGISAGGFAAAVNAPVVQHAFPNVKVALVDDSGPPMSQTYLPSCLQQLWRTTWGLDNSMIKECGSACPDPNNFVLDYMKWVATSYSDRVSGLVDSATDSIISAFYGYGTNNCTGSLLTPVPGATYTAGLEDFRTQVTAVDPKFSVYIPDGSQHTWLTSASMYTESQGGVTLVSWFTNIVNNVSAPQVGP